MLVFFFKRKTAYEMRISDWSSDVCSSDLIIRAEARRIDIRIGDDDVLDLSLDAAIDLAKIARAWQPGGALPWVWARRRIAALVHGHVGTFAQSLDETPFDIEARAAPASVASPRDMLRFLAARPPAALSLDIPMSI